MTELWQSEPWFGCSDRFLTHLGFTKPAFLFLQHRAARSRPRLQLVHYTPPEIFNRPLKVPNPPAILLLTLQPTQSVSRPEQRELSQGKAHVSARRTLSPHILSYPPFTSRYSLNFAFKISSSSS